MPLDHCLFCLLLLQAIPGLPFPLFGGEVFQVLEGSPFCHRHHTQSSGHLLLERFFQDGRSLLGRPTHSFSISSFLVIAWRGLYLQAGEGYPPSMVPKDELEGFWCQIRDGLDHFQHRLLGLAPKRVFFSSRVHLLAGVTVLVTRSRGRIRTRLTKTVCDGQTG